MIRAMLLLLRPKLSILNGVAAASGCLLVPGMPDERMILAAFCGVAFMTAGGSAINQVMEKDTDCLMMRTRLRPLPQGQFTPALAGFIGIAVILAGLSIIAVVGGLLPAIIGVVGMFWYLGVYTPLKHHSSFALALGGICGSIPPVIGWTITGGNPTDFRIVLLSGLLYLWQVPHFWLLLKRHENDYRIIGIRLPGSSQIRSAFMGLWITALTAATILLPVFGIVESRVALWYLLFPLAVLLLTMLQADKALFYCFNLFPLLLTLMLGIQKYL